MELKLKAIYVAKELSISRIRKSLDLVEVSSTRETAVYKVAGGKVFLYSFGSAVFVGCDDKCERTIISSLKSAGVELKHAPITESYILVEDPKVKGFFVKSSDVSVRKISDPVVKVVAGVLAQSVALESYEEEFDKVDTDFSSLNSNLAEYGSLKLSGKDVMRMIARNNLVLDEIMSGIGVLDKPESAWESSLIDGLHTRLAYEFELKERFENLNTKIDFLQDNYKLFLESIRGRYEARLEWIIIILIFVEIVLFLYELFFA